MRNDPILMHYGIKGMKWRKGRKTSQDAGKQLGESIKVYEKRQSQLRNGFGVGADVGSQVAKRRLESLKNGMKNGKKYGSKVPKSKLSKPDAKPKVSKEYEEELNYNSKKNKYPKKKG